MKRILLIISIICVQAVVLTGQNKVDVSFYTGMGTVPKPEVIITGGEIVMKKSGYYPSIFLGVTSFYRFNSTHSFGLGLENGFINSRMYELNQSYIDNCIKMDVLNIPDNKKISFRDKLYITNYTNYWSLTPQYRYRHMLSERNILHYKVGLQLRHYIPYSVSNILAATYRDSLADGTSIIKTEALPVESTSYSNSKYLNGKYNRSQFITVGFDLGLTYKRIIGKKKKHALSIGMNLHYEPRYSVYSKYETTKKSPVYSKGVYMINGNSLKIHLGYHWLF